MQNEDVFDAQLIHRESCHKDRMMMVGCGACYGGKLSLSLCMYVAPLTHHTIIIKFKVLGEKAKGRTKVTMPTTGIMQSKRKRENVEHRLVHSRDDLRRDRHHHQSIVIEVMVGK